MKLLVRVDLNTTIKNGVPVLNLRFKEHGKTVKELSKRNAVVLLAHQGRRGGSDFLPSLENHAKLLSKVSGVRVEYCDEIFAHDRIEKLRVGEVLLLGNVRRLSYETVERSPAQHAKSRLVKELSPHFDGFVLDAFSVAHRSHASVVGFTKVLRSWAGPVLEREVEFLSKVKGLSDLLLVLGGAKLDEPLKLIKKFWRDREIITGGLLGEAVVKSQGYSLGLKDKMIKPGFVKELKKVRVNHPVDFVTESGKQVSLSDLPVNELIVDIGSETVKTYVEKILSSENVLVKGPMSWVEKVSEPAANKILSAASKVKGLSIVGGGDTTVLVNGFNFSHVSTGGGAMINYLVGEKLPGLTALGLE